MGSIGSDENSVLMFACNQDLEKFHKLKRISESLVTESRESPEILDSSKLVQVETIEPFEKLMRGMQQSIQTFEKHLTPLVMVAYVTIFALFQPYIINMIVWSLALALIKVLAKILDIFVSKKDANDMWSTAKNTSLSVQEGKNFLLKKLLQDKEECAKIESASMISTSTVTSSETFVRDMIEYQRIPKPNYKILDDNALSVPVHSPRIHIKCVVGGEEGLSVTLLLDLGASSSALSRKVVDRLEAKQGTLPRLNRALAVRSFNASKSRELEVVITSLTLPNGITVRQVPFLLSEASHQSDGLVGMNVISSISFLLYQSQGPERTLISFKRKGLDEDIQISPNEQIFKNLQLTKDITIMAQSTIDTSIPCQISKSIPEGILPTFRQNNLTITPMAYSDKDKSLAISIVNDTKSPVVLPKGLEIDEIMKDHALDWESHLNTCVEEMTTVSNNFERLREYEVPCICDLRRIRSDTLLFLNDKFNINTTRGQPIVSGMYDMSYFLKLHWIQQENNNVLHLRLQNGKYPFHWETLSKLVKRTVRVVFSFREKGREREECKIFLENLRKQGILIKRYYLKSTCPACKSLCNFDNSELFKNCQRTKIFIMACGNQPIKMQRRIAVTSPIEILDHGSYCKIQMMRSMDSLIIYVHVLNWHTQQVHRFSCICSTLLSQLRILQSPRELDIYSSWQTLDCHPSQQILSSIKLADDWETSPIFKLKDLDNRERIAPFCINRCSCNSCTRLRDGSYCMALKALCLFTGNLSSISKSIRVNPRLPVVPKHKILPKPRPVDTLNTDNPPVVPQYKILQRPKSVETSTTNIDNIESKISALDSKDNDSKPLQEFNNDPDTQILDTPLSQKNSGTNIFDKENFFGVEDFPDSISSFPTTLDADEMKKNLVTDTSPVIILFVQNISFFLTIFVQNKVLDWRETLPEEQIPKDPKLRAKFEAVMDKYNKPGMTNQLTFNCNNFNGIIKQGLVFLRTRKKVGGNRNYRIS